jgi:hypothetical protein
VLAWVRSMGPPHELPSPYIFDIKIFILKRFDSSWIRIGDMDRGGAWRRADDCV